MRVQLIMSAALLAAATTVAMADGPVLSFSDAISGGYEIDLSEGADGEDDFNLANTLTSTFKGGSADVFAYALTLAAIQTRYDEQESSSADEVSAALSLSKKFREFNFKLTGKETLNYEPFYSDNTGSTAQLAVSATREFEIKDFGLLTPRFAVTRIWPSGSGTDSTKAIAEVTLERVLLGGKLSLVGSYALQQYDNSLTKNIFTASSGWSKEINENLEFGVEAGWNRAIADDGSKPAQSLELTSSLTLKWDSK